MVPGADVSSFFFFLFLFLGETKRKDYTSMYDGMYVCIKEDWRRNLQFVSLLVRLAVPCIHVEYVEVCM